MAHWLARAEDSIRRDWIKRFDPCFWTVNFARPMMAAVTTTAADALRVDAVFYTQADLAGLIWEAEDRHDHPLLAYETSRDFRGLTLAFRWRSSGVLPLDAVNGPVLTIEGRDAAGAARAWYVRLWNYAVGTPTDATISLDFDAMDGGFVLPGEADRVWAGDIDRLFISLVPPGYTGVSTPLAAAVNASAELSAIRCEGGGATLTIGDAFVPPHAVRLATGYDDSYDVTPARILRGAIALGYRRWINHYVGMSHYFELGWNAAAGRYLALASEPVLNKAFAAWHADFMLRARALGVEVILSLSYELFDGHAPDAWKQRAHDGTAAATGYAPPSTLLSPGSPPAMEYLQAVARALVAIAVAAGQAAHFQVGEPWWWVGPDRKPCIHDASTEALYLAETGRPVPPRITSADATWTTEQRHYADWAGGLLGRSTLALRDAAKSGSAALKSYLLFYAPQVLAQSATNLSRLNLPAEWAHPAFDVFQLEDYDFVVSDDLGAQARARATVDLTLGYPKSKQQYFAGFAAVAGDSTAWARIEAAAASAAALEVGDVFFWAYPQIIRDGFVHFDLGIAVQSFADVQFPLALGLAASAGPTFSTQVVTTASGYEQRNSQWASARLRFDAGLGVRAEKDLVDLITFFRARRGRAIAFRLRDPSDFSSKGMIDPPGFADQILGTSDGVRTRFALIKRYDANAPERRITRPELGSVRVGVAGAELPTGWVLDTLGTISFLTPPAAGAAVTAGYRFDVPVRFAEDSLDVSLVGFRVGEVASVPLIEVREG